MSSRAWTEVATGAEARSFRRWMGKAVLPIVARWGILLVGILLVLTAYSELYWAVTPDPLREYPDWYQFENLYEPGIRPSYEIDRVLDGLTREDHPRGVE